MRNHVPTRVYCTGAQSLGHSRFKCHLTILPIYFRKSWLIMIFYSSSKVSSMKLRWQFLRHYSYRCLLPKSWSRSHETHSLRFQKAFQKCQYGAEHMLLQPQPHEWDHDAIPFHLVLTPDEFITFECRDANFRWSYHNHLTPKRLFMAVMSSTSTVRSYQPVRVRLLPFTSCCLEIEI